MRAARDTFGNEATDVLTVTVNSFTCTMAEGATGAFVDTYILIIERALYSDAQGVTFAAGTSRWSR